jgi:hypothetical protein
VSGQLHSPAALPPGEKAPGTHWIGGCVNPRAGLDDVGKRKFLTLPGLELRPFGRPAHSQSLYRLLQRYSYVPMKSLVGQEAWCVWTSFLPAYNDRAALEACLAEPPAGSFRLFILNVSCVQPEIDRPVTRYGSLFRLHEQAHLLHDKRLT